MIGRICEAFRCRPTEALHELDRLPVGFVDEILEALSYARAKDLYDQACARSQSPPDHPMVKLVQVIEFQLVQEARAPTP